MNIHDDGSACGFFCCNRYTVSSPRNGEFTVSLERGEAVIVHFEPYSKSEVKK